MSTSQSKNDLVLAAQRCSVGEMVCECDSDKFHVLRSGDDGRDPKVIYQLGMSYHYGWGTAKDLKAAIKCYVRAAELGSYEALWRLHDIQNELEDSSSSESDTGCNYNYESSWNEDFIDKPNSLMLINLQNAFRSFYKNIKQGDARRQFNVGFCHFWGIGTLEDEVKARDLFLKATDQKCADAMYMLEVCRHYGVGDGYNGMSGTELLKYAAELGSVQAQFELGYAYWSGNTTQGLEVEQDYKQAVEWFQKAADQNHTLATYYLAGCYYNGYSVQKNPKKAFQLWKKAALMGHGYAQNNISDYYSHKEFKLSEDEWPVGIDFFEAAYWDGKALDQNREDSMQSMLDVLKAIGLTQNQIDELIEQTSSFEAAETWYGIARQYETGNGVEKDEQKAFKMYKLAARLGSIPAKTVLGRCYELGIGTDVDAALAARWRETAAVQ